MSENAYRLGKLVLLTVAVIAGILIGLRWAENGRFIQYDRRAEYSPDGRVHTVNPAYSALDTRTGKLGTPTK